MARHRLLLLTASGIAMTLLAGCWITGCQTTLLEGSPDWRLIYAAGDGDIPRMKAALAAGAEPNTIGDTDSSEITPLDYAVSNNHRDAVGFLLQHGAAVDRRSFGGEFTPLMSAASSGYYPIVQLLLEHGADPNAMDYAGRTPLMSAAEFQDRPDILRLLVSHGAILKARDRKGNTALTLAQQNHHPKSARFLLR